MQVIAFDGACKANGKPDCISMGAMICKDEGTFTYKGHTDYNSTNQRGELNGCILALRWLISNPKNTVIITDSQYIYNAITKEWYKNWERKGWVTANNDPVKNRDLWEIITSLLNELEDVEWAIFHVKGHMLSIGPKTASNLFNKGINELYEAISTAYIKPENVVKAKEVFVETHEIDITDFNLRQYIDYNTVADYVAVELLKEVVNGLCS